jgi:hypothetical protein
MCFENSDYLLILRFGETEGHFEILDFDLDQIENLRDAIDIASMGDTLHFVIETPK